MKARLLVATALAAAAVTVAGCSTDDAVDAVTSGVAKVSTSTAAKLSEACRTTKAAATDIAAKATSNPPAALTEANAALDTVAVNLSSISIPEPAKAAWTAVVGDLSSVGDVIDRGVAGVTESPGGQAVAEAASQAADGTRDLAAGLKDLTADLGLSC